tara:strand:+ start:214 stop:735 length:522 start_codon:yes stop_codon:yes gene_type:complete
MSQLNTKIEMIDFIILILVLIGLIVHRYLSSFWEQNILPYSAGFVTFANLFALIYLINFIKMFGIWFGIGLTLLCFFQLIYATFLWPFLLPTLKKTIYSFEPPKVNVFVYSSWSFIVISLLVLTIINFFVSDNKSLYYLVDLLKDKKNIVILISIVVLSNIVRGIIMKKIIGK